jgi:hypothetical protein
VAKVLQKNIMRKQKTGKKTVRRDRTDGDGESRTENRGMIISMLPIKDD